MVSFSKFALVAFAAVSAASAQAAVVLDFEGIADYPNDSSVRILGYYSGKQSSNDRQGRNVGASFSGEATVRCLNTAGIDCAELQKIKVPSRVGLSRPIFGSQGGGGTGASRDGNPQQQVVVGGGQGQQLRGPSLDRGATPSDFNGMYITGGTSATLDFAPGFKDLSFIYVALDGDGSVKIFDGFNGEGQMLGALDLPKGAAGCPDFDAPRCPFSFAQLGVSGLAHSVVFSGVAGDIVFDDVTLSSVPETASWAMLIAGFGLTGAALRRRRETAAA